MKKIIDKLFSPAERVLVSKDLGTFWKLSGVRSIMFLIPIILIIVLPVLYLVAIFLTPSGISNSGIQNLLPEKYNYFTYKQCLYYIFVQLLCPLLFILIPILTACFGAFSSFVLERENGTMESLLFSSFTTKSIFKTKCICIIINSIILSIVSLLAFTIITSIGNLIIAIPFFFNGSWAVIFFLLSPAVICLSIFTLYLINGKSKSIIKSFSSCGYIVVPFTVMFIGQFAGLYDISWQFLLVLSLLVLAADVVLYIIINKKISAISLLGSNTD